MRHIILLMLSLVLHVAAIGGEAACCNKLGSELKSITEVSPESKRGTIGAAVVGALVALGERDMAAGLISAAGEQDAGDMLFVALVMHSRTDENGNAETLLGAVESREIRTRAAHLATRFLAERGLYSLAFSLASTGSLVSFRDQMLETVATEAIANGDSDIALQALRDRAVDAGAQQRLGELQAAYSTKGWVRHVRGLPQKWQYIVLAELRCFPAVPPPEDLSSPDLYMLAAGADPSSSVARWLSWGIRASVLQDRGEVQRAITEIMQFQVASPKDWCGALPVVAYLLSILGEGDAVTDLAFSKGPFENARHCGARRASSVILASLVTSNRFDDAIGILNSGAADFAAEETFAGFAADILSESEFLAVTKKLFSEKMRVQVLAAGIMDYSISEKVAGLNSTDGN